MTRKLAAVLMVLMVVLVGCADTRIINGTEYDTYGLLDRDEVKNPDIHYRLVWGNIVWSVILSGTVVAPIYFVGFSLWEPVMKRPERQIKGQVLR